jgi:hypothetical protein
MDDRKNDSLYEGRDKAYMDVDRMINEGMAGGTVNLHYHNPQIDQAIDFYEEEPPKKCEEEDC